MKKATLIILLSCAAVYLSSQNLTGDLDSYMPKFYQLIKDSADFRYHKTFSVSKEGSQFSSISSVLDFARKNKLDTLNILIYGNLDAETVYIDTPFRFISVCGVNSACNAGLSNTVIVNRADSIFLSLQNLSFSSLKNSGYMAYMGFFHNMIESMTSTKDVAFSDIFASEITEDFNWPSSGYLVMTQGKGVGKNFYGIISNCLNKRGDTLIIYGKEQKRELYFVDNFIFGRYMHITGYLNVQNQISVMNGKSVSVIRANEAVLSGNFKARSEADSIFFSPESKSAGVTLPWRVTGDITVEGSGLVRMGEDGTFFIKNEGRDSVSYRGGTLNLFGSSLMGEGNIFMGGYNNSPGKPLLMKYNMGVNNPVRWAFADGDRLEDFSMYEDSANSIIVKRQLKPDTLSKYGSIEPLAGSSEWRASKAVSGKVFSSILFEERETLRGDSLFSWDKKSGSIKVNSSGIYYAGYSATVKKSKTTEEPCKAALRLLKNKAEEGKLNSVTTLAGDFEGLSTLTGGGVIALNAGDVLSLEFYSSSEDVTLEGDDVFSSKNAVIFYLNQVK